VSDTAKKKPEPDAELLEFLGDIDEANDENRDDDFSDFLANNDIDKLKDEPKKPAAPAKVKND
jgi:hypothetical protein